MTGQGIVVFVVLVAFVECVVILYLLAMVLDCSLYVSSRVVERQGREAVGSALQPLRDPKTVNLNFLGPDGLQDVSVCESILAAVDLPVD